ncbi:MAG: hypothetical protein K9N23_18870 [Akkermansiaceae bacterium]|nr:hypothetical protein [Akkermansiaceae bacterium]MCF7733759.1 hypothetical protein [Akkermansiaceae bacterium]
MVFDHMLLWLDPVPRAGPEAMAVDEWLLEQATSPVLRVYQWSGAWATIGYFGELTPAREAIPGVGWVRRWTGGGVVDHRADWTYTVAAPAGEPLASCRGAESYQRIHRGLEETLRLEGLEARLSTGDEQTGSPLCFANPVPHDLVDTGGHKLAGAGQRRTKTGLLHQGSVAAPAASSEISRRRAGFLASRLATTWELHTFAPPPEIIAAKVAARYANPAWTNRR